MKPALLDVNLLVALAWPNHIHHDRAHAWFAHEQRHGWATCPLTQSAFVRVSSNPRAVESARTPREAIELLRGIVALPHHRFWADDTELSRSRWVAVDRIMGYRQVTDAHLLALALRHRGRLATFDAGVKSLLPAGAPVDAVVVLAAGTG